MALFIYQSNRLESLAEGLIIELNKPHTMKSSLFNKEIIIVQNRGMDKWLSMEIATENGISANIEFPFPKSFIYNKLFPAVPDLPDGTNSFNPEIMSWKIMRELPELIKNDQSEVFNDLKSYLGNENAVNAKLKLYQLSGRIADVFDQYMVFRPDMLLNKWDFDGNKTPSEAWKKHRQWQLQLFDKITARAESSMPPQLCREFISRMNPETNKDFESLTLTGIPPRIFIFGVSVMPPQFIDIFMALSRKIDVHFFYMVPCREYFADIEPANKAIKKCIKQGKSPEDMHFEETNPLLASMGKYGQEFQKVVTEKTEGSAKELFKPSNESDLLSIMQDNILTLEEKKINEAAKLNIQLHACYNPVREVEVLYDNLLSIIETEKVEPKDILVMTPDIAKYSPFIRTVFDTPEKPASNETTNKYIPYSLADRTLSSESPEFKAFLGILEVSKKRYNAAAVVDILDTDGVREKFNLNSAELSVLRTWLADCKVSWGIDATYREEMGLPAFEEGSWRTGLKRMLLGFALGTEGNEDSFKANPFNADRISPYDMIEENNAIVLGKFIEFTERIFEFGEQLAEDRTLNEWGEFLILMIKTFIASGKDNNKQLTQLIRHIEKLPEIERTADYNGKLPLDVVKAYLLESFKQDKTGGGFMHCGVTFCEMQPMRSIPFKVICMLGMNDGDFPRQTKRPGFDLMLDCPDDCDREQRYEDKYLLLEAMLSAREYLYISYTGISMDDNKYLPPSVLISDLLDYLTNRLGCTKEKIFTRHPLQSFSYRNYFTNGDPKIFSYSNSNYLAAKELFASWERKSVHVFWTDEQLLPADDNQTQINLESLVSFFKNPAKYFLKNRLNLRLDEDDDAELDEEELFDLNSLQKYHINQVILKSIINQNGEEAKEELKAGGNFYLDMMAKGMLPVEPFASTIYKELLDESSTFAYKLQKLTEGHDLSDPVKWELKLEDGVRLTGNLRNLYKINEKIKKQVLYFFADESAKYKIEAWLNHLAINTCSPVKTVLLFKDKEVNFPAMGESKAVEIMNDLTAIFKDGCSTHPLPFFPKSAYAFVNETAKAAEKRKDALAKIVPVGNQLVPDKMLITTDDEDSALKKAAKQYEVDPDSEYSFGDAFDKYIKYCFTEDFFSAAEYTEQLEEFKKLAKSILGPMLESIKQGKKEKIAEEE